MGQFFKDVSGHSSFWPAVALVVLLVACGLWNPVFFEITVRDGALFGQLIDIVRNSVTPLLLAMGMCLVIATGGIDLSVGAVMAISLSFSLTYLKGVEDPNALSATLVAVGFGLGVALLVGAFNGFMVTVLQIQPFIATMILMVAGRGIAMLMTKGQITTVRSDTFKAIGSGSVWGIPIPVIIGVVAFVALTLFVRKTAFGMQLESIGINKNAARVAGIKSRQTTWTVYIICGVLAGLAGLVYGSPTMAADANNIGLMKEMDAIMVVVLGGTSLAGGRFSLGGTIVGALILSTLERAVIIFGAPAQTTPLFKAVVLIIVCILASPRIREYFRQRDLRRSANGKA